MKRIYTNLEYLKEQLLKIEMKDIPKEIFKDFKNFIRTFNFFLVNTIMEEEFIDTFIVSRDERDKEYEKKFTEFVSLKSKLEEFLDIKK